MDLLRSQNEHFIGFCKVRYGMKRGPTVNHWVLEVEPDLFGKVMKGKTLTLNWQRLRVTEHVSVLQCFRCLGFGHKQSDYKGKPSCLKCGKTNHMATDCKSKVQKCANCSAYNREHSTNYESRHAATSIQCPLKQREVKYESRRTDYG